MTIWPRHRPAKRPLPRLAEWVTRAVLDVLGADQHVEHRRPAPRLVEGSVREPLEAAISRLARFEPEDEPPRYEPPPASQRGGRRG